jgi:DUF4097 and DUF4098 domain-containing protein YvlB
LGTLLVIIGLLGFVVLMGSIGWDFTKLGTSNYETNTYEMDSDFANICIDVETADITFVPSDDGKCKVVCHEDPDERHLVFVDGDTLSIASPKDVKFHINWLNFDQQKITVYLPKSEYTSLSVETDTGSVNLPASFAFGNVDISLDTGAAVVLASATGHINIETDTGSILMEKLSAGSITLGTETGSISVSQLVCSGDFKTDVDTGRIKISDSSCKNFFSDGDTGDIHLDGFIASKKITIQRDTGDVRFSGMDAAEIYIENDTGDIEGSLLSGKMFTANTNTGRIRIPDDTEGGICKLTTNTGDIKVTIED